MIIKVRHLLNYLIVLVPGFMLAENTKPAINEYVIIMISTPSYDAPLWELWKYNLECFLPKLIGLKEFINSRFASQVKCKNKPSKKETLISAPKYLFFFHPPAINHCHHCKMCTPHLLLFASNLNYIGA